MKNMNKKDVRVILNELGLIPDKNLGQNFLTDKNLLTKIISISEISEKDIILEVGGGLGTLTSELAKKSKRVIVYELDYILYQHLQKKFSRYKKVKIINQDILKAEIPNHNKIISNIPFTITGPLLEKLFYKEEPPSGILIIEKRIADRIFKSSNYKNLSRITISFNSFMTLLNKSDISSNSFFPTPRIELSLIKIAPKNNINPFLLNRENREFYLRFIAGIMPYKNKNITNALDLHFKTEASIEISKEEIHKLLTANGYQNNKVFMLNVNEFIELSQLFFQLQRNYR